MSRATGGAPTYASRPRPTPVRDRLPACALSLVMRLVQAFEAVFLFGFRFARPTRERRGRYRRFLPGYPAFRSAHGHANIVSHHDFHTSDTEHLYNTYTTGSTPRLTHNNVGLGL